MPRDQEWWRELRVVRHSALTDIPTFVLKDVLERPHWHFTIAAILACLLIIVRSRHSSADVRNIMFWLIFNVLLAVRCLGTFSGTIHFGSLFDMILPTNAASPFKGLFLQFVLGLPIWNGLFVSRYHESVKDFINNSSNSSRITTARILRIRRPEFETPWRDTVVRLAYYHTLDSTLHVLILRYFWAFGEGQPYTKYINNEEVLAVVLTILMAGWTWIKVRAHEAERHMAIEEG